LILVPDFSIHVPVLLGWEPTSISEFVQTGDCFFPVDKVGDDIPELAKTVIIGWRQLTRHIKCDAEILTLRSG